MASRDFVRRLQGSDYALRRPDPIALKWHVDLPLVSVMFLLCVFGLVVLYSASGQNLQAVIKQGVFFLIGFVAMFGVAQIHPRVYRMWAPALYVVSLLLLVAVLVVGDGAKGAQRWLDLPGLPRFQPSEILKLAMPMTLAWALTLHPLPPSIKQIFVTLVLMAIPIVLVMKQPDLGTSILIAASGCFVLLLAGLSARFVMASGIAAIPSGWVLWMFMHDYQKRRVLTFLNPEADPQGTGWNIIQSKTAIGSGGLQGQGYLEGAQSQLNFLPEGHTDFILAVLAEELGFVGVVVLFSLYVFLILRGLMIAASASDGFGRLLAGAVVLSFASYVIVNVGMVSGMLPVVGVPLPFISQGGTSVVSLMLGLGVLMSVQTHKSFSLH